MAFHERLVQLAESNRLWRLYGAILTETLMLIHTERGVHMSSRTEMAHHSDRS